MSDHESKPEYEETFYIIPRHIRKIPKITLAFLDVYETIFQFWNKRLPCFLSNSKIQERTGLGHSVVGDAIKFFEDNGELERKIKNGKRYFVQPLHYIETDDDTADAAPPYRSCGTPPTAAAVHNIKKDLLTINKKKAEKKQELKPVDYQETLYDEEKKKDESFSLFWNLYPIKKSKNRAMAAWYSQSCELISEKIIEKLKLQIAKDSVFLDGYAPNPDKYIMQERWNDEIYTRKKKSGKRKLDMNDRSWAENMSEDIF